jgi:carbon-monoxide dehydrogenase large subunit
MGQYGIGQPVRRKEDVRLLIGGGEFTDDISIEGATYGAFVRSPHANARILNIDTAATRAMPGVIDIITGAELEAAGMGKQVSDAMFTDRSGRPMSRPLRSILPTAQTRFVGECIVMVVAQTQEQAREAAEAVEVDYEPLPAVVATSAALAADAPKVWPEFDSNMVVHWEYGDAAQVDAKLAGAAKRVSIDLVNNRLAVSPMEPRVAAAVWNADEQSITVYSPTQGGRRVQTNLSQNLLKMPMEKVRVISRDTGGGFGIRSKMYPETAVVAFAARKLGRPVKWRGDRLETFMSDYHGRDQLNRCEMGLDANGRIVALKVATIVNVGAYLSENGVRLPMEGGGRILPCMYHVPDFYFSVKPVFTNTICTDTYRGAGRPEANYIMERLMDAAAEACGLPRDEIRRRNFIAPDQMPYKTHLGFTYDSGDFAGTMDMALEAADWAGFEQRRKASAARGKLRGIGISTFIEGAGSRPIEGMRAKLGADGRVTLFAGTYSHGQGHHTVYSQIVNDVLGVDFDRVDLVDGDTALAPETSNGTFGSRSATVGGNGVKLACDAIVAKGKRIAAHLLQAQTEQVEFSEGVFRTATSSIALAEIAAAAYDPARLLDGMSPGLDEEVTYKLTTENFPNGAHIVEVEVDPDLGDVEIVSFVAVDDCGVVLNPFIVHGQANGGIAQGLGQALTESVVYDEAGQLMTASYMDYAMPRAHHLCHVEGKFNIVPCKTNALGVKGAGEAGATGAPPAIVGAVVDALKDYGIRHIDMPLTPQRVWQAIAAAKAGKAA